MSKSDNEIVCKYIFDDDYNPKYVNGAYGGLNWRGEFVINFYLEREAIPKKQVFKMDEESSEEITEKRVPDDHRKSLVRVVENGVVMDYENAKSIHRWLGKHLKEYEKMMNDE